MTDKQRAASAARCYVIHNKM